MPGPAYHGRTHQHGGTDPAGVVWEDVGTGGGGSGVAGHVIEDEGTPLTQRANLNFVGSGVTAADSGGETVVTIPGGSGSDIGARAYLGGVNQSIPDGSSWTTVDLAAERFDTDGIHSTVTNTGRFTAVTAGKYLCWAQVVWAAAANGYRQLSFYSNTLAPTAGAGFVAIDSVVSPGAGFEIYQSVSTVHALGVGDYVEMQVRQTSGGALNILYLPAYAAEAGVTKMPG